MTDSETRLPARTERPSRFVILCHLLEFVRTYMATRGMPVEVRPESTLTGDLGLVSLEDVELVFAIEDRFGVDTGFPEIGGLYPGARDWSMVMIAHAVHVAWGTRTGGRRIELPSPLPPPEFEPFTQACDPADRDRRAGGPLLEPAGVNREGFAVFRRRTDGMRCVLVPAGEAVLGSDETALPDDCRPARRVPMSAMLIDAEPVSVLAFCRFLNAIEPLPPRVLHEWCGDPMRPQKRRPPMERPHRWRSLLTSAGDWAPVGAGGRQPMVMVSWYGANAYSLWANRRDWRLYRGDGLVPDWLSNTFVRDGPHKPFLPATGSLLPTEAQWEYAARGGDDRPHPWGHEPLTLERAVFDRRRPGMPGGPGELPLVDVNAKLGLSRFGLHHMAGNVFNWCADWYDANFPKQPESRRPDPVNLRPTGVRCERGGGFAGPVHFLRCEWRSSRPPQRPGRCLGFRCVSLTADCDLPLS